MTPAAARGAPTPHTAAGIDAHAVATRVVAVLAVAVAATLLLPAVGERRAFISLYTEDHLGEYATAAAYLAAGAVLVILGLRQPAPRLPMLVLGTSQILVGAEEVSWGQRIFGFSTPDALVDANVQAEVTLHNIDGIHQHVRMVGLALSLGFYVVWPLIGPHLALGRWARARGVPVPRLYGCAIIVAASVSVQVVVVVFDPDLSHWMNEASELLLSLAPLLFAAHMAIDRVPGLTKGPGERRPNAVSGGVRRQRQRSRRGPG